MKPGTRQAPVTSHCTDGNLEHFRSLFKAQAAEETQLYNLALSWRQSCQRRHCFIERDNVRAAIGRNQSHIVEVDMSRAGASFGVSVCTREVDQYPAHQLCGDGKEMRAVLPLHILPIDQPQICFVDER